jgi:hypothetical protein
MPQIENLWEEKNAKYTYEKHVISTIIKLHGYVLF